jgi:hypothetical protein
MHSVTDSKQTSFDAAGMTEDDFRVFRSEPDAPVGEPRRAADVELPDEILDALSELYWLERARPEHASAPFAL